VGPALALSGRTEWAIFWKNAMQTFRAVNLPMKRLVPPAIGLTMGLSGAAVGMSAGLNRGPAGFIAALAFAVTAISVVAGPLIMRLDLRSDFEHLELLKTWPVRPAELIRGEMAWPAAFVTAIAWAGILCAALFSGAAMPEVPITGRVAVTVSALFAAPALIAAQYTVQNALALFFPAWVSLGTQRTRGLDAMGQRLIMLGGTWLLLTISMVPGAIAGGIVWFALERFIGTAALVPAALVCSAIVGVEVLLATEAIGPAYERLDLLAVERSE
jgi:hypothetical protein